MLVGVGATNVLIYWAVLAVSQAISYFSKYQEREYRLAQAQLQSLKAQLHPHFFFNTLNAISELVHTDPEAADRTITGLSDLLRLALQNDQAHEVPLRVELEFLRKYISIQQMLLDERLSVEWQIDETVLEACVPTMVLQPLVENAVRHGIEPRAAPGHLRISAARTVSYYGGTRPHDALRLIVQDNGLGLPAGWSESRRNEKVGSGIGLLNTRERLRHLYGEAQRCELETSSKGGVTVTITLPLRMEQKAIAPMHDAEMRASRLS